MTQAFRLSTGGIVDRTRPLRFEFDGRAYEGFSGDSLASALLANGIHLIGRSFKYHRPRGIVAAGVEEPNALVPGTPMPNPHLTDEEARDLTAFLITLKTQQKGGAK